MLKSIIPSLLIAGAAVSSSAFAAEPASQNLLGFEFGVGFQIYQDDRFDGVNGNIGVVLPIGQKFEIVVFHESAKGTFRDDNDVKADNTFSTNEIRFRLTAWENESQAVKFLLGIGYFDDSVVNGNINVSHSGMVADIGIDYTVVKAKSGPVKGQIALNAVYRFARPEETVDTPFFSKPIDNYNGVIIGATAGLYF